MELDAELQSELHKELISLQPSRSCVARIFKMVLPVISLSFETWLWHLFFINSFNEL